MKMNSSREGRLHMQERILGSSPLAWAWRIRSSSFFCIWSVSKVRFAPRGRSLLWGMRISLGPLVNGANRNPLY